MNIQDIIESYHGGYNKEYKVKLPQVVTTEIDEGGGTIMRRVRVTDKETMCYDGYDEHDRETYETYNMTIQPRKFYSMTDVVTFMTLLLKTVANGRQYELTCLIDRTEELKNVTKWVRV